MDVTASTAGVLAAWLDCNRDGDWQDAGEQIFAFDGLVRTRDEPALDVARIVVEYRDWANANVLESWDSGSFASAGSWQRLADERPLPAGTTWVRLRLIATRMGGPSE